MPRVKTMSEKCVYVGCNHKAHAVDLCVGHHKQYQRGQPLKPLKPRNPNRKTKDVPCVYDECTNNAVLKNMCRKHYIKVKRALAKKGKPDGNHE